MDLHTTHFLSVTWSPVKTSFPQTSVGSTGQRSSQMPKGQKGTWVGLHLCQGYPCDLGKSLYLSGPRFLRLGLCGEVGWGIIFGYCQGCQGIPHTSITL